MNSNPLRGPEKASDEQLKSAEKATESFHYVDSVEKLEAALPRLQSAAALGVDTEFVRERTFLVEPGLVQVSDGQEIWLLDPVTLEDDGPLGPALAKVLAAPGTIKVVHSTGEDLEVFERVAGTLPAPLFDTQIAAAMLGWPLQYRYESLVADLLEVELPGGKARNDWRRRPLAPDLLRYAAQDVIWLDRLRIVLSARLERVGRLEWLIEDCARVIREADTARDPVIRIKGAAQLDDAGLQRLTRLAEWRETQAVERNLPRGFVLKDPVLLGLARRPPANIRDLEGHEGVHPGLVRRHGPQLLELLSGPVEEDFERPAELRELDAGQRTRVGELQKAVRAAAESLDMDPALIASKRELIRMVQGIRPGWLDGWRGDVLGPALDGP